eukprot:jgi/Botrbrau1/7368/Bobra.0316s0014.1
MSVGLSLHKNFPLLFMASPIASPSPPPRCSSSSMVLPACQRKISKLCQHMIFRNLLYVNSLVQLFS